MDLNREMILDHYQHPRNWRVIYPATFDHEETNPFCGDHLRLMIRVEGNRIAKVGWSGEGCALSCATASMLGERLLALTLEDARQIEARDVLTMLGFAPTPVRMQCALLSLKVLKVGVYGLTGWNGDQI